LRGYVLLLSLVLVVGCLDYSNEMSEGDNIPNYSQSLNSTQLLETYANPPALGKCIRDNVAGKCGSDSDCINQSYYFCGSLLNEGCEFGPFGVECCMAYPPHFINRFCKNKKENTLPYALSESKNEDCVKLGCPPDTEFVGSSKSDKYHRCECEWAGKISRDNLLCFKSRSHASSIGYQPCKVCKPP